MRYLNNFANESEYSQHTSGDGYLYPDTSYVKSGMTLHYNDYEKMPLTFQIIGESIWREGDTYSISLHGYGDKKIKARINYGEWEEYSFSETSDVPAITGLTPGDIVQLKSDVSQKYWYEEEGILGCTTKFSVFGNINSLNAFSNELETEQYMYLFAYSNVVSARNLILPATDLSNSCYSGMFNGCTSLTIAPELPATTLKASCYYNMFADCTSLTTAPELPATTLKNDCYGGMFNGCTSLTSVPELPATTLANNCYANMFYGCTSLTTAPELPATTLAGNCYGSMFSGCTSLTTAPELPATTLANYCYDSMFRDCTSLTTAPQLPATALMSYCYQSMFRGCTSLTTAPALPATILATGCYSRMFQGCTNLNHITCMATSITATYCTSNWVSGVSSTGVFVYSPSLDYAEQIWSSGVNGVPIGWSTEPYIYFHGNGTLAMWVDDFPDILGSEQMEKFYNYEGTFQEYITENYFERDLTSDGNTFRYMEPFVYDDKTYYMWYAEQDGDDVYVLTETIDMNRLYNMSMEANIDNRICPFYAVMNDDTEISYIKEGNDMSHVLVKTWTAGNSLYLHIDDFPTFYHNSQDGYDYYSFEEYIKNYLKNPGKYYSNLYEYSGEKIEYDGDEYYVWVFDQNVKNKKYLLTDTINLKQLENMSVEKNITNRNHPAAYLTYDLDDDGYVIDPMNANYDVIAKVFDERRDMRRQPLTFEIISGGNITWSYWNDDEQEYFDATKTIQYSKNGGAWTTMPRTLSVSAGDKVQFRGDNSGYGDSELRYNTFAEGTTAAFNVKGNIMSLINSSDFVNLTGLNAIYTFCGFFHNCEVINASNLALPAMTLAEGCYQYMFGDCTGLTKLPELQVTILEDYCYYRMFEGCTSLTLVPELPATTLAQSCYGSMFYGCTNLTTAPALPATTLTRSCYYDMFYGCTSLTTAPALPATTLAQSCYGSMFRNCTSLTTAPELPATTLADSCYSGMFANCTSLATAPELTATTLANNCYNGMFTGCASLTTAPALPATTLANTCYRYMFQDCTNLTAAPALPATALAQYCYSGMFRNCTNLTAAPALPATTLAPYCYQSMFSGCTNLTTAPTLPATTLADNCYEDMFYMCTSLASAPTLPATTMAPRCYREMFDSCSSLTVAPSLPATTLAESCYSKMFRLCTALTTAPTLPATTLANSCYFYMFVRCALTTAPELPATTLAPSCYASMFQNCSNLRYVKAMFTSIPSSSTNNWLYGVSKTGTFVKNNAATWDVSGPNGIPTGWTVQTASE